MLILLSMWPPHKAKMQMSSARSMFLSLGPHFILSSSLPSGNILEKDGHSTLKIQCPIISDRFGSVFFFFQCGLPYSVAWELVTPFLFPNLSPSHKSVSNNYTVKVHDSSLLLFCTRACLRQAYKGITLNLQWHYGRVKPWDALILCDLTLWNSDCQRVPMGELCLCFDVTLPISGYKTFPSWFF